MNIMKLGLSLKRVNTSNGNITYKIKYQPKYIEKGNGFIYRNEECNIRSDSCPEIDETSLGYSGNMTIFIRGAERYKDYRPMVVAKENAPKVKRAITDFNNHLGRKNKTYIY